MSFEDGNFDEINEDIEDFEEDIDFEGEEGSVSGSDTDNTDDELSDDDVSETQSESQVDIERTIKSSRSIRNKILSKFEWTKILGERITQISNGAPSTLEKESIKNMSIEEIVRKEITEGKCPLKVKRRYPSKDGKQTYQVFSLSEMYIIPY